MGCFLPPVNTRRFEAQAGRRAGGPQAKERGSRRLKRFVTALCTDMCGYTGLSAELDCEDLGVCMSQVMDVMAGVIEDMGGLVEKFVGDAVIALFGLDRAREDDPLRAVLAARRIHLEIGRLTLTGLTGSPLDMAMHTGIHTGEVIVDAIQQTSGRHGALGMPINMASRLCELAARDQVLVSEAMVPVLSRFFFLEWMGPRMLKGLSSPINVYLVLGERSQGVQVHRVTGLTSPMVGRDNELSVLLSRFRGLAAGEGGVVCIGGEAGIGKSRLVREFVTGMTADAVFLSAGCQEHTGSIPYHPVRELVGRLADMAPSLDSAPGAAGSRVSSPLLRDLAVDAARTLEFGAASAATDVAGVKERISDVMLGLFKEISSRRTTVICIEDLHWADQSTIDLLAFLAAAWSRACPCLILLTHRSGWTPEFPASRIVLRELASPHVSRMISCMLGGIEPGGDAVECLERATGGNPFFLEEMVNYLVEKGMCLTAWKGWPRGSDVPESLKGFIASRIDGLEDVPRRTLQEASLLGRVFRRDMLEAVSSHSRDLDADLDLLSRLGFLDGEDVSRYSFRHDIIREVASASMLKDERALMHGRIVDILESSRPDGLESREAMLARHSLLAGRLSASALYHVEAAQACLKKGAWFEAASWYTEASRMVEGLGCSEGAGELFVKIMEGLWTCCRVFDPDRAAAALETLARHYRHASRNREEAFTLIRLINLHSQQGRFNQAFDDCEKALQVCGGDAVLKAAAMTAIAYTYTFLGRPLDALALLDSSRPLLEASNRFLFAVNALSTLAASVWKGDLEGARAWYETTREAGGGHLDIDLMSEIWLYHVLCLEGGFEEAGRVHEEVRSRELKLGGLAGGLSYLRIQGSVYFGSRYLGDLKGAVEDLARFGPMAGKMVGGQALETLYGAWIALERSDWEKALGLVEEALPGLRQGVANRVPYALTALAEARLMLGDAEGACAACMECIERTRLMGNLEQHIWALRLMGEANVRAGRLDEAASRLDEAELLARKSAMIPQQAWILASRGALERAGGREDKAVRLYEASAGMWGSAGNTYQADRALREKAGRDAR